MPIDFVRHVESESDRFLTLLREADPSLRVPSCPDWDADDLLWHLGEVQWFWGTIVGQRLDDPDRAEELKPDRPGSHDGLIAFFAEADQLLRSALLETDPAEPVWMWADEQTAGYVARRMAHEALIHRLDAELTVGDVTPLDVQLASDGVHEVLTKFYAGVPEWGTFTPAGRTVLVETTDTGLRVPLQMGRWAGTSPHTGRSYDESALDVLPGAASGAGPDVEADATVRGAAADLDVWLWARSDAAAVEVTGDRAAFDHLQEVIDVGID